VEYRLRIYTIREGGLGEWLEEWRAQVVPLRRRFGFEIAGAWASEEDGTFVWLLGYRGDYERANAAYYASEERRALEPDPARNIAEARELRVTPAL
jgi:hypothetical protein